MQARCGPQAVVGVAASAGGVEALRAFAAALPADFPATVLVVLHIRPTGPTVLPEILARAGRLPARHPQDGEPLEAGVILVAPPDRHLTVADGHATLLAGPRENGHRPSGDVLLRSLADSFGAASSGVVLSGTMDDGAAGLAAIRRAGGFAAVQAPDEALFPSMPLAAIAASEPQAIGPASALAGPICRWVAGLSPDPAAIAGSSHSGAGPASAGVRAGPADRQPELTPFTCTECGGTLWLQDDAGVPRLRCRVGHTLSVDGLLRGKHTALERALWAAVVALEERADLSRRIAARLENSGRAGRAEHFRREVGSAEAQAKLLRRTISELIQRDMATYRDGDADDGPA